MDLLRLYYTTHLRAMVDEGYLTFTVRSQLTDQQASHILETSITDKEILRGIVPAEDLDHDT